MAGVEECTIDGFCGVPENLSFSIRNLQSKIIEICFFGKNHGNLVIIESILLADLEYLVLEAVNNEWQIYGNVFSEFRFPKLRYFCVDIEGSITVNNTFLFMKSSRLEA